MPPPFTAEERDRITELLLKSGYELFTTQGLRKTSLEELVRPAGIAKSSFYAFFDSKEALYLELLLRRAPRVQRELVAVLEGEGTARAIIGGFLRATARELETDPLYRRLLTHPDELHAVQSRIDPERVAAAKQVTTVPLRDFIERARRTGQLVEREPAVVLGVLRAVLLLPLHRADLGEEHFPQILDLLIDMVAAGLTTPGPSIGSVRIPTGPENRRD